MLLPRAKEQPDERQIQLPHLLGKTSTDEVDYYHQKADHTRFKYPLLRTQCSRCSFWRLVTTRPIKEAIKMPMKLGLLLRDRSLLQCIARPLYGDPPAAITRLRLAVTMAEALREPDIGCWGYSGLPRRGFYHYIISAIYRSPMPLFPPLVTGVVDYHRLSIIQVVLIAGGKGNPHMVIPFI